MKTKFTMFGYDKKKYPYAKAGVDVKEAEDFAREHGLTGYFLAPEYVEGASSGGMTARMLREDGRYRQAKVREWTFVEGHLTPGVSDGSEYVRKSETHDRDA